MKIKCNHVKINYEYFADIASDKKNFEVRKDDRGYKVGDLLRLYSICPKTKEHLGPMTTKKIIYKLNGGIYGIEKGYCVLGLGKVSALDYKNVDWEAGK